MATKQPNRTPVHRARVRAGLCLAAVASQAGIALATAWAADHGLLTDRTAAKLAPVLGVRPGALKR
jgi:hypothetical protein